MGFDLWFLCSRDLLLSNQVLISRCFLAIAKRAATLLLVVDVVSDGAQVVRGGTMGSRPAIKRPALLVMQGIASGLCPTVVESKQRLVVPKHGLSFTFFFHSTVVYHRQTF